MIQILLAIFKLSLPGPNPTYLLATKAHRRKKKGTGKKNVAEEEEEEGLPLETDAERLESYMDKIVVWQLTASIDRKRTQRWRIDIGHRRLPPSTPRTLPFLFFLP